MNRIVCFVAVLCLLIVAGGCANIVPPSGGPKDETPPQLLRLSPGDSLTNTRVTELKLTFDEYVTLNNPSQQIQLSPLISAPLEVSLKRKTVTVKIPDSVLQEQTTYQLSFGNAIQDVHENNPFTGFSYLFSTGPYFDSLQLEGRVFDAATGLPDTSAFVLLYPASAGDSALVRSKPQYVTHVDAAGYFRFKGLPGRDFQIYALRDLNNNLTFDGGSEWLAFYESLIRPQPDTTIHIGLYLFQLAGADTAQAKKGQASGRRGAESTGSSQKNSSGYQVLLDTNTRNRTFDLNRDLMIQLSEMPKSLQEERIFLSLDSAGITTEAAITVTMDTAQRLHIATNWQEDAVYELRLQKGFATDSAGNDLLPGTYAFRTKRKEDYGAIRLRLPEKYSDSSYLLQVYGPVEGVLYYSKPIVDTVLTFQRLTPGNYTLRIIHDENKNGLWDSGTLFPSKQPETVIPYPNNPLRLREGWEHEVDFEPRVRTGNR